MKYTMNCLICCMIGIVVFFSSCSELSKDESILSGTASELISDIDGNTYKTVTIGEQTWFAENLRATHFRNGDPILHVTGNYEWFEAGRDGIPAWRYYNDDPSTAEKYGKLYNGFAVSDPRGLAPEGWRLPGDADWEEFIKTIGGKEIQPSIAKLAFLDDPDSEPESRVISYHWILEDKGLVFQLQRENNDITSNIFDASMFNLVASGHVDQYGNFYDIDERVRFWSYPTEKFSEPFSDGSGSKYATFTMGAYPRVIRHSRAVLSKGQSVRLIKE